MRSKRRMRRDYFINEVSWQRYLYTVKLACYINKLIRRSQKKKWKRNPWEIAFQYGTRKYKFYRIMHPKSRFCIWDAGPMIKFENLIPIEFERVGDKYLVITEPKHIKKFFNKFVVRFHITDRTYPIRTNYINDYVKYK